MSVELSGVVSDELEATRGLEEALEPASVAGEEEPRPGVRESTPLRFVPLEEFAEQEEASAEALIGTADDMLLAAGGTLLMYGDAGASKTTLTIDAVLHLGAGIPWLGLEVPRPLTVLLIENEGPRGPFRRKLERKRASWAGASFAGRVSVLEEPWAAFSFGDELQRAQLAGYVAEHQVDLIVCGPLVSLGAIGGGTPEEVARFEALLRDFHGRLTNPVAIWLTHHENKAGDVSGAWERLPDALLHARLEGRERTMLHLRKVRWSSRLHGERWTLQWATESEGFELVDEEASAAVKAAELEDAREWIVNHVNGEPGPSKSAVENAFGDVHGKGGRTLARRAIEEELTASTPRLAVGPGKSPSGKYLYPASGANSPLAADLFGEYGESESDPGAGGQLANSPPPRRGKAVGGESADGVQS